MFERFTDRAREAVVQAQGEARLLRHNYIGTEHLLLGILREGTSVGRERTRSYPTAGRNLVARAIEGGRGEPGRSA